MDNKIVILPSPALDKLMVVWSAIAALKAGQRNSTADQRRVQQVHNMAMEMGVTRDCNKKGETKANARFSKDDMAMVDTIHDHAVNLGAECSADSAAKLVDMEKKTDPPIVAAVVEKKSINLEDYVNKVRREFADTFCVDTSTWSEKNPYCVDVLDDSVVGRFGEYTYQIPYVEDTDGDVEFETDMTKWTKVEKEWQPVKSVSLTKQVDDARSAFYAEFGNNPKESAWCIEVMDDSVVARIGEETFKVPYSVKDSKTEFDKDRTLWGKVEQQWQPVKSIEALSVSTGGEVKTGANGHLCGYLVRFSTAKDPDTTGDYFSKDTDFQIKKGLKSPVYFHHTLPLKGKKGNIVQIKEQVGEAELELDENGVLIDAIIFNNAKYRDAIMKSVKSLGWSSGTASHLIVREKKDASFHIKRWPLGLDASLTPTPAEPRNEVIAMKTIQMPNTDLESEDTPQAAASSGASVPAVKGSNNKSPSIIEGERVMDPKELVLAFKTALAEDRLEQQAALKKTEDAKLAAEAHQKEIADAVADALKAAGVRTVRQPVAVNAGGAKTGKQAAPAANAVNDKTQYGDDAFKAFNFYLKTGDREALRDMERERGEDGALLDPDNFKASIEDAQRKAGMKTTYNVLEGTQYQGQELVPTEVYNRIIELRDPMSIARIGGATVIPIGAKTMNVPIEKNRSGRFVIAGEGSGYDANAVQPFDKRAITAFKFTRTIAMGIEVMEDSMSDLTGWWNRHVARMEALTENYNFVLGAAGGASAPEGITTGGTLGVTTATGAAILATEVVKLYYKLPQPYRNNVSFMCNGTTEGVIRALSGNWFQFQPTPSGSGGGNYPMGSDWIVSPKCKLLGASDMADIAISAISAIVGNWEEYIIAERSAMSIFRDPYSSASSGLVNFHCHFRRGGMVGIAEAFQYLKGNTA